MQNRLWFAFGAYLFLAALAIATLTGGIRLAILILLVGLATKTWIASRREP